MLGEPEAIEQHGMTEGHVRLGESDHLGPDECARQLGDGGIAPPCAMSSTTSLKLFGLRFEAHLDAEPDAMSRASVASRPASWPSGPT